MTEAPDFDASQRKERILLLSPLTDTFFDTQLFTRSPALWHQKMNSLYGTVERQMKTLLHWDTDYPDALVERYQALTDSVHFFPENFRIEQKTEVMKWLLGIGFEIGHGEDVALFYEDIVKTLSKHHLIQEDIGAYTDRQQDAKSVVAATTSVGAAFWSFQSSETHLQNMRSPLLSNKTDSERLRPFKDFLDKIL
jgi:hypothetical protein